MLDKFRLVIPYQQCQIEYRIDLMSSSNNIRIHKVSLPSIDCNLTISHNQGPTPHRDQLLNCHRCGGNELYLWVNLFWHLSGALSWLIRYLISYWWTAMIWSRRMILDIIVGSSLVLYCPITFWDPSSIVFIAKTTILSSFKNEHHNKWNWISLWSPLK